MMQLTADSKLLRRIERVNPLPYVKQAPLPRTDETEPDSPEVAPVSEVTDPSAVLEEHDDFGPPLDPPENSANPAPQN